ncbi:hypothetical protein ABZ896_28515 [Streptomyces sp. NPDC047072]|uniref:hypothetical protein n=1 Tax=Streptomyces sp. NPDC047072 TaxID=3154809 RepID=UPI00340A1672
MTTVTLPTVSPPRPFAELTAWYGPLPVRRRRVALVEAVREVSDDSAETYRLVFDGGAFRAAFVSDRVDVVAPGDRLQLTGDLTLDDSPFPVLLRLRIVDRTEDRLLAVGTALLPYRLLRRATGFRLPFRLPATRLRLLVAGEFA